MAEALEEFKQRAISLFKQFDADDSGNISKEEMCAVFQYLGQNWSKDDVDACFGSGDADGNGYLNYEELLSMLWLYAVPEDLRFTLLMADAGLEGS